MKTDRDEDTEMKTWTEVKVRDEDKDRNEETETKIQTYIQIPIIYIHKNASFMVTLQMWRTKIDTLQHTATHRRTKIGPPV